jgi:signal transduction histidine kinase
MSNGRAHITGTLATADEPRSSEPLEEWLFDTIVHDLKNPIYGIEMIVDLALRRGDLPEPVRTYLRQVERNCRELTRLVQNMLEISKIDAGIMPAASDRFAVDGAIDAAVSSYAFVLEQTGRSVTVDVADGVPPVVADARLFHRVLVNLLVNSLRHGGSRRIHFAAGADDAAAAVVVTMADDGRGIPADAQATIFDRNHARHGETACDSGLGLPFCRRAMEHMRGGISLTSAPARGTVFTLTLPAHRPARR